MNKVLIMLLLTAIGFTSSNAQQKIRFDYDQAGNQIKREYCFGCSAKISNEVPKEIEEIKPEDLQKFFPEDAISYYPNPVKEELFLKWELVDDKTVASIKLISLNGAVLMNFTNLRTNTQNIVFQSYPNGIYIIELIYSTGEEKTIKIIKQ